MDTVTKATRDASDVVVESDSAALYYKPWPPSKSIKKHQADTICEIERVLAEIRAGFTRTDVGAIIETRPTKWPNNLHSQSVKAVEIILELELQAAYFNSYNDLRSTMFSVGKHALGEMV